MIDTDKLDWTKEAPQKEGYYFCRNSVVTTLEDVVEIYRAAGDVLRIKESGRKVSELEDHEFAGPLEDLIDLRS